MAINVMEMFAKLSLDDSEFTKGLNSVSDTAGKVMKGIGVAVGVASTAVVALTKQIVDSYADYEQNIGGIKKLYGNAGQAVEDYITTNQKLIDSGQETVESLTAQWQAMENDQNTLIANASNAYKTAGMSANTYMETATQFSASLISSVKEAGGATSEAVELTDKAMVAISDNWNTFGGDLESITNAYKGFSKQNYTMLDNLKLGYGGTKEEMERLIADANEYAESIGEASDLSIESFADIVKAIDLVQQEQSIAGTTAREATTTIGGSLNMMKSAWANLVTGLGDSTADIDTLVGNLVNTAVGYTDETGEHVRGVVDNLLPVIETALSGIVDVIDRLVPIISKRLPELVSTLLPNIISSASSLVAGLISVLPTLLSTLISMIPTVISKLINEVDWSGMKSTLGTALSDAFDVLEEIGSKAFEWLTGDGLSSMIQAGTQWLVGLSQGFVQGIPDFLSTALPMLLQFAESLRANATTIINAGLDIIVNLVQGLINGLPHLIEYIPTIITNFCGVINDNAYNILATGVKIIGNLIKGLIQAIPTLVANIPKIIEAIVAVWNAFNWINLGKNLVTHLANGIKGMVSHAQSAISSVGNTITNTISAIPSRMFSWGKDMISNLISGITSKISSVASAIGDVASTIASYIHFSEPDIGPLSNFHTYAPDMMKEFAKGITDNANLIESAFDDSLSAIDTSNIALNPSISSTISTVGENSNQAGNSVVMNVYASDGMDVNELAQKVSDKLNRSIRRGTSFA